MEYYLRLMSCVLLVVVCSSWSEAAPASTANQQANGPSDVRWRIVSGLETAYMYAEKLVSIYHHSNIVFTHGSMA